MQPALQIHDLACQPRHWAEFLGSAGIQPSSVLCFGLEKANLIPITSFEFGSAFNAYLLKTTVKSRL